MWPETARAFAMKGAEILVWPNAKRNSPYGTALGIGGEPILRAQCIANGCYGVFVNNGPVPGAVPADSGAGDSTIFDNLGRVLAKVNGADETIISTTIPISLFRKSHSIPVIRKELYDRVYADYIGKYPPNMYSEYLPKDPMDAVTYARKKALW